MSVLLLLACPPAPKESPPPESRDSDSAENQESPPDTDCTAIEGYTDMDGDGYGDPTQPHTGCVDDRATADNNQDCDDTVATIHPFAEETCDGVDQDCDGERDENATDVQSYYADADGDGHGDPGQITVACTPPSGTVEQADDCDDSEALAWTGATEICGDGVDQDCDPTLHPCLLSGGLYLRDAGFRIEGGNPTDAAGAAVASIGDWDGDGVGDLLIGAPFTDAGGTVYIAPMVSGSLGTQPSWSAAGPGEFLGEVVLALPDLDGDGRMEPAAGGSLAGLGYGQLQIYNSNQGNLSLREVWTGQEERKFFGDSIANLGDQDGDGWPSLAVGATLEGATQGGCVFVGEADGVNKTASGLPAMCGPDYASAGSVLAAVGDVDGDGLEDLLVGSNPDYRYATSPQVVWLITAPIAGNLADVAAASWDWESTNEGEGSVVAGAGDVDADGHMDLLVGAPTDRAVSYGLGAAFLIVGNPSGAGSLASADAKILGSGTTFMWLGTSVAAAPDIDGDSLTDLAVGANNADDNGASSGTVFLLSGTVRGTVPARGTAHTWLMGEAGDAAGHGVGQADDQDGDGLSELWVSSTTYGLGSGAVWGLSLAGPP